MKTIFFVLLSLSCMAAHAQYSNIIVQFTDKGGNPYSLSAPGRFLSVRALERRTRYNIGIDSTDLPIVPRYIDSIKAQGAVSVLSQSKWLNQVLIQTSDSATIRKIRTLPFVKYSQGVALRIIRDEKMNTGKFEKTNGAAVVVNRSQRTTADVYDYGNSYNQIHIHEGEYLHNKGFSGQGIMITLLDAGFSNYRTITAFDSIRLRGQVLGERDFVAFDSSVNEDDQHGKNCLSIMAANWPGLMVGSAPRANYWLVRTEDAGSEQPVEEHNWVVGAEFADSCGTDLISSSLGYTTFGDASFNHSYSQFYSNSTMVTQGATLAARKGIIVTNSAGNEGNDPWKYLSFPADADSVCAVGAVNNAGQIAGFSSYGYPGKQKPDIVSVGEGTVKVDITSTSPGNGTSYSNPNIAGLIACLWQAFPRFNNMKILTTLYASSSKSTTPDERYGYGIPNMKTAYRALKAEENQLLYGSNWLRASPAVFADTLGIQLVSQADGNITLDLLNAAQAVVATKNFPAEKEEGYQTVFTNLGSLPDGNYTVRYNDGVQIKTTTVLKTSILPLTGLTATARWTGKDVQVEWSTLSESNTSYFQVLRSTNGTDFTALNRLPATGNSPLPRTYSYKDADAESIRAKILYYRIVAVDKDNRKTFSYTVKLLNQSLSGRMVVYPNPAKRAVQLLLTSDGAQPATIRLFNHQGQLVKTQQAELTNGGNTITMNLAGVTSGEYLISVQTDKQTVKEKLLVQ